MNCFFRSPYHSCFCFWMSWMMFSFSWNLTPFYIFLPCFLLSKAVGFSMSLISVFIDKAFKECQKQNFEIKTQSPVFYII